MQERVLKATIIALTVLLSLVLAFGAFLVAGTQKGNPAPVIKAIFNLNDSESHNPDTLPIEDKQSPEV